MKFKPTDVVRTKSGTLCVVDRVNERGALSLVLPARSAQRSAWYESHEVEFVASLKDLVATYQAAAMRQNGLQ